MDKGNGQLITLTQSLVRKLRKSRNLVHGTQDMGLWLTSGTTADPLVKQANLCLGPGLESLLQTPLGTLHPRIPGPPYSSPQSQLHVTPSGRQRSSCSIGHLDLRGDCRIKGGIKLWGTCQREKQDNNWVKKSVDRTSIKRTLVYTRFNRFEKGGTDMLRGPCSCTDLQNPPR